jgi:hypothetical protein
MAAVMTDYFEISDLPSGRYRVGWEYPGMVNSASKLATLADIVFDTVKSDVLDLAVALQGGEEEYVSVRVWDYHADARRFCEHYSQYYVIVGCRLATREQADCLVREFEKRLVWKRLQRAESQYFD